MRTFGEVGTSDDQAILDSGESTCYSRTKKIVFRIPMMSGSSSSACNFSLVLLVEDVNRVLIRTGNNWYLV